MARPADTTCYYCGLRIAAEDKAIHSRTDGGGDAWAHVTCWYDGGPFERQIREKQPKEWE